MTQEKRGREIKEKSSIAKRTTAGFLTLGIRLSPFSFSAPRYHSKNEKGKAMHFVYSEVKGLYKQKDLVKAFQGQS